MLLRIVTFFLQILTVHDVQSLALFCPTSSYCVLNKETTHFVSDCKCRVIFGNKFHEQIKRLLRIINDNNIIV